MCTARSRGRPAQRTLVPVLRFIRLASEKDAGIAPVDRLPRPLFKDARTAFVLGDCVPAPVGACRVRFWRPAARVAAQRWEGMRSEEGQAKPLHHFHFAPGLPASTCFSKSKAFAFLISLAAAASKASGRGAIGTRFEARTLISCPSWSSLTPMRPST